MKDYDPLFPNRKEEDEVTLADVIGSFFDVIRAAIPTKDNPLKAEITYTTPKASNLILLAHYPPIRTKCERGIYGKHSGMVQIRELRQFNQLQ